MRDPARSRGRDAAAVARCEEGSRAPQVHARSSQPPERGEFVTLPVLKPHAERFSLCAYCPKMCRFSCPVAEADAREALTPWGKMSAGFLLSTPKPGLSLEAAFETSWGCTACGHCTDYCAHGNEVPLALAAIRAAGVAKGLASPATD